MTALSLDVSGAERHTVNADPVDWALFRNGFRTPFGDNRHGSQVAKLYRGAHAAVWDWDPDKDGVFDEMPSKVVDNLIAEADPAAGPRPERASHPLFVDLCTSGVHKSTKSVGSSSSPSAQDGAPPT